MKTRFLSPLVPLALLALPGCDRGDPGRVPPIDRIDVTVSEIGTAPGAVSFPARVVAAEEVEIATRSSGIVRRVNVDVGSVVRPGEVLVALEAGEATAAVASARADARLARKSHDRIAALAADGAATAQELDEMEARLESAEAAVREAESRLDYVRLSSPIAGVVTERRVDPGDLAVPGRPVLALASTADLVVEADLPGERAGLVEPGTAATVIDPRSGSRAAARVTRVVPALEGSSRRFRVEAVFAGQPPAGLLPGEFARLEIEAAGPRSRWIPADAIVRRGQMVGVYVVEADTAHLRWVRTGREGPGAVEVLAGPPEGSRIVRRPVPGLTDGAPIGGVEAEAWDPHDGDPVAEGPLLRETGR